MRDTLPRTLSHPLPAGMRDLLPEEARRRRTLARRLLDHFALHGYQLVTLPAFEFAEVLERGLGTLNPSDVLRFVEPESGEIAALRPDMTPQIARMVATRLALEPRPIRLCYEGTIVRRRQDRARRNRQVPQAGVELYGCPAPAGDIEILRLSASVLRAAGLSDFVLDLGHAEIARTLLDALEPALAAEVNGALAQKDAARVGSLVHKVAPAPIARALAALPDLHGDSVDSEAVFREAERLMADTKAAAPLAELFALFRALCTEDDAVASALRIDLGEVRGFAYYTGAIFHFFAPGPGEPIGAGGRYDDLLARFDAPMPATGFALSLDALAWALEAKGAKEEYAPFVLVTAGPWSARLVTTLRARGVPAIEHAPDDALAYARAWQYTHLVTDAAVYRVTTPEPERIFGLDPRDAGAILRAVLGGKEKEGE